MIKEIVEYNETTQLLFAIYFNKIGIIESLLSNKKVDVNAEIIDFYRTNEGKIFKRKQTVLHFALIYNVIDVVRLLTSVENIDVNALYIKEYQHIGNESKKQIEYPMYLVNKYANMKMVDLLISTKKEISCKGLIKIGCGEKLKAEFPSLGFYETLNPNKKHNLKRHYDKYDKVKKYFYEHSINKISDYIKAKINEEEEDVIDDSDCRYEIYEEKPIDPF